MSCCGCNGAASAPQMDSAQQMGGIDSAGGGDAMELFAKMMAEAMKAAEGESAS